MGDSTTTSPSIPGALNIIYPYYKDLSAYSEAYSSTITYTNGITSLSSQMSSVNGFIQTHMDNTFSGTGMMVVDWFLVSGDAFRPAVSITPLYWFPNVISIQSPVGFGRFPSCSDH